MGAERPTPNRVIIKDIMAAPYLRPDQNFADQEPFKYLFSHLELQPTFFKKLGPETVAKFLYGIYQLEPDPTVWRDEFGSGNEIIKSLIQTGQYNSGIVDVIIRARQLLSQYPGADDYVRRFIASKSSRSYSTIGVKLQYSNPAPTFSDFQESIIRSRYVGLAELLPRMETEKSIRDKLRGSTGYAGKRTVNRKYRIIRSEALK